MRLAAAALVASLAWSESSAAGDPGRSIYREDAAGRRACVHCHGRDGRGGGEGNPPPPDITWPVLSRERGYAGPEALAAALAAGRAPDGKRLAMLQVELAPSGAEALAGYLGRISEEDRRGAEGGTLIVVVGTLGEEDAYPGLLERAWAARSGGRTVFGMRIGFRRMTLAEIADLPTDAALFAAFGVPETVADTASAALARADIPNLMPRGLFVGDEPPEIGVGLFPTLSRVVDVAERDGACKGGGMLLSATGSVPHARLERFLRIPVLTLDRVTSGAEPPGCRLILTSMPGRPVPTVMLAVGSNAEMPRVFDPLSFWSSKDRTGLARLAEITADRIFEALVAARGRPGRAAFVKAFRGRPPGARWVETPSVDLSYPNLSGTQEVEFVEVTPSK